MSISSHHFHYAFKLNTRFDGITLSTAVGLFKSLVQRFLPSYDTLFFFFFSVRFIVANREVFAAGECSTL